MATLVLGATRHSVSMAQESPSSDASNQRLEMSPLTMEAGDDSCIPPMTTLSSIFHGFESLSDRLFANRPGAKANHPPLWGPARLKLVDPKEVPRITSLDNDDASSFFYTYRPNLFNIEVEDEWDWNNLINTD